MKKTFTLFMACLLISSIAEAKTVHHHLGRRHHSHYVSDKTPDETALSTLLKKHNKLKKQIMRSLESTQNLELKKNFSAVLDNVEKNISILEN
ncbi:MAG: hypothetical protein ACD_66C00200G0001 [uncultured bacterium]|nr:MAG: hypothetical protein ACD_66C00200G0001 [uncultured bacterium]